MRFHMSIMVGICVVQFFNLKNLNLIQFFWLISVSYLDYERVIRANISAVEKCLCDAYVATKSTRLASHARQIHRGMKEIIHNVYIRESRSNAMPNYDVNNWAEISKSSVLFQLIYFKFVKNVLIQNNSILSLLFSGCLGWYAYMVRIHIWIRDRLMKAMNEKWERSGNLIKPLADIQSSLEAFQSRSKYRFPDAPNIPF